MDRAARRRAARGNGRKVAGVWLSNAPFAQTGYGTQTAQAVGRIIRDGHPFVVACNYGIEATTTEWEGIPLWPKGFDAYSTDMATVYLRDWERQHPNEAAYLFTLYNVWTLRSIVDIPVVSWVPVDHLPVPPEVLAWCRRPNVTSLAMSKFGLEQLQRKDVDAHYVPHAIETSIMKPTGSVEQDNGKRLTGRQIMAIPEDAFVVTIMNANKGVPSRKAFGEQVLAFSIFANDHPDAVLFVHSEQHGHMTGIAWDPLIAACGLDSSRVKFINQYQLRLGIPAEAVACILTASDVLLCPTYGEGFGITALDAQACGTPIITSDFTAQKELAGPDSLMVSGQPWWDATQQAWWQIPSVPQMVDAMAEAYRRGHHRSQAAIDWVREEYDADVVFDRHWRPVLAQLAEGPRASDPAGPEAYDNGKRTDPGLTIYIPTKGRPELAALLKSLAPQLTPDVEVIVSDNTGAAYNTVRQALQSVPCRIEYSRRSYDINGDANIGRGFSQGTAPWVWMIGDDDVIADDGITSVLEALQNAESAGIDRLILLSKSTPKSAAGAIASLADIAKLDPALPIAATLISANVIRRDACNPAIMMANLDCHYGHAFAWPKGIVHVLENPVIERVGYEHAGEGIPADWDGHSVKAAYLRYSGIEPGPESFAWNYMSAGDITMVQPVTNKYCTIDDVKLAARIPQADTQDDDLLDIAVISASRSIDGITNRHFYQSGTATRYYVPQSWLYCDIDDVAASTATVAISSAADGTYDITLGAADIQYEPLNRRSAGLVFPATRLRMVGDYSFPTTYDGETTVRVTANFGFATAVPTEIRQATMLLAARFYKRFDSPLGVAGFGDLGAMRVSRTDPDIHAILQPFIHPRAIGIA